MKVSNIRKTIAGIMSLAMTLSAPSTVSMLSTANAADSNVVYSCDFENEDDLKNLEVENLHIDKLNNDGIVYD